MLYKLLGIAVWKGGKLFLRRRYGPTYAPAPALVGAAVALLATVFLLTKRNDG